MPDTTAPFTLTKPKSPQKWVKADALGHLCVFVVTATDEVENQFDRDGSMQLRVTADVVDFDAETVTRAVHIFGALAGNIDGRIGSVFVGRVVEGDSSKAGWNKPIILEAATDADEKRVTDWLQANATNDPSTGVALRDDAGFEPEPF